ncbi:rna-directed dna polymerase from mobile element jockey- hypothetical protein [Limosa lapponica baueri]|uniref:Uncharacterized protein n=1 Tax=Limosa lapponica baueri TaxID=1758121 RepID=A0A2I0UJ64_LIMLA|nr:rna-directed dna polymerase from mobile element jockey- hypothetical protein [Limosa lapponica baueri]
MGPDGMHPRVLRELADVITKPLSIFFEKSWRTGEVPKYWRKDNVTPVFKKGKKEDPGNYRPVSFTSILGKVKEQLILDVISKHVKEKKVIMSDQYGFTKEKSYLTSLIAFYDGMTVWVDEGRAVDVVYLDFSKAFILSPITSSKGSGGTVPTDEPMCRGGEKGGTEKGIRRKGGGAQKGKKKKSKEKRKTEERRGEERRGEERRGEERREEKRREVRFHF